MAKPWTREEKAFVIANLDGTKTYAEISNMLGSRHAYAIEMWCQRNGLSGRVKNPSIKWSKDELELLDQIYPTTPRHSLENYFEGKTFKAIEAMAQRRGVPKSEKVVNESRRGNSQKAPNYWCESKSKSLCDVYDNRGIDEAVKIFGFSKEALLRQLRRLGHISQTRDYNTRNFLNSTNYINLAAIFKLYKGILAGEMTWRHVVVPKVLLPMLFKYYLRFNGIKCSREDVATFSLKDLLGQSRLEGLVVKNFDSLTDFVKYTFPSYKLKDWEFKTSGVIDGYWDVVENRDACWKECLDSAISKNIIDSYPDILGMTYQKIELVLPKTLAKNYGKSDAIRWLDKCKIDYSNYNAYISDGIFFDSMEEKEVYLRLKTIFTDIRKPRRCDKYHNSSEGEAYIPDFIVDNNIIIEYFGLYRATHSTIFGDYMSKAQRKIEYFSKLSGYRFIGLFGEDLKPNVLENKIGKMLMT